MQALASILMLLGLVISFIGGVWFIIAAFQDSLAWGLLCLFLPITSFLFLILHADRAFKPFFVSLFGTLLLLGGVFLRRQLGT